MEILKSIFEVKSFHWWRVNGLLLGLACILTIAIAIHPVFNNKYVTSVVFLVLSIVWLGVWLFKNRLRKIKKKRVGILICIHSKDPDVDERVREDFVSSLKNSLDENNENNLADIIVVPYHIASRYNDVNGATSLLNKTHGHYLLFGLVKNRENRHILDLTAYVRHIPLTKESQAQFKKDISSAWVSRYNIENADKKFELFEISSEIVSLCSRYIIGLAAFASLDFTTSEILFTNVRNAIRQNHTPELPATKEIRRSLTDKLNSIYFIQAQRYLRLWNETRDTHNISIINELLQKVFGIYKRHGEYLTLKAIIEVLLNANFHRAKRYLLSIKKKYRDAIWYLNMGFLEACLHNESSALINYKTAVDINAEKENTLSLEKISEFENFICWYMTENKLPFLHYLLGVLNENFKGDLIQALHDYRNFIDANQPRNLTRTVEMANRKIAELSGNPESSQQ